MKRFNFLKRSLNNDLSLEETIILLVWNVCDKIVFVIFWNDSTISWAGNFLITSTFSGANFVSKTPNNDSGSGRIYVCIFCFEAGWPWLVLGVVTTPLSLGAPCPTRSGGNCGDNSRLVEIAHQIGYDNFKNLSAESCARNGLDPVKAGRKCRNYFCLQI